MALVFKQQQQVVCVAVLIMCMAVTAPLITRAAITCGQVTSSLSPCISYLKTGGSVPAPCCNGVRSLNSVAATTPDRQAACKCIQEAASRIPGINPNLASGLPGQCGVNIPYKISPSTNCNSVK